MGQSFSREGIRNFRAKDSNSDKTSAVSQSFKEHKEEEKVALSLIEKWEPKLKIADVQQLSIISPLTYSLLSAAVYEAASDHPSNLVTTTEKNLSAKLADPPDVAEPTPDRPSSVSSSKSFIPKWRNAPAVSPSRKEKNKKEESQSKDSVEVGAGTTQISLQSSLPSVSNDVSSDIHSFSSKSFDLPVGWTVFLHCKEVELERDGFCAVAYINRDQRLCIIAFRGTASLLGLRAGIWMFFQELSIQFFLAEQFSKVVREKLALDFDSEGNECSESSIADFSLRNSIAEEQDGSWVSLPAGYHLSYTGHSLGAVMASVRAVDEGVPAVTFESPGCHGFIERVERQRRERQKKKSIEAQWGKGEEALRRSRERHAVKPSLTSSTLSPLLSREENSRHISLQCVANTDMKNRIPALDVAPHPETLLTNYLQPPNAINTLHRQIGYCIMLPVQGPKVEEEVLLASRHAISVLRSSEERLREKKSGTNSSGVENEGDSDTDEDVAAKTSSLRRFVPKLKASVPTISLPGQGFFRSVLFSSIGMSELMEILQQLEPHFKELMSRTRQQHSIKTMVMYFQKQEIAEPFLSHRTALPDSRADTVLAQGELMEVVSWPSNSLQYMEYLNAQRGLQEPDVEGNWNALKAYQRQLKYLFDVVEMKKSRDGVLTFRPLSQRYLPPCIICLIDGWRRLEPKVRQQLPLRAIDHAVLNASHLTEYFSPALMNISARFEGTEVSPRIGEGRKINSAVLPVTSSSRGLYVEDWILSPLQIRDVLFRLSKQKHIYPFLQKELYYQSCQHSSHL